ncbi:hypothetical protein HDV05_002087 [Chytridiales sp. JEL 0842]|nr:hypothetical protein HDV05_002087 [Chytridiales sp. JEL 0842]
MFGFGAQQQQQQPQQQQPSLFGGGLAQPQQGFGAAATPGFGAPSTAFGAAAPTGGFGATTGFGAPSTGGFGAATNTFGAARPGGFGAAAPTTLFTGANTNTTTGFGATGGFGATTQQPTGFGAASTTGGFGAQQQTGFGATGTSTFGSGFNAAAGAPAYGAPGQTTPQNNCGTGNPPFQPTPDRDSGSGLNSIGPTPMFQSICTMPNYVGWSPEELRLQDYAMNKKSPSNSGPSGFGAATTTGFGAAAKPTGFGFGATPNQPTASTTGFGAAPNTNTQASFGFGSAASTPATGGLFGQPQQQQQQQPSLFGGGATTGFGAQNTATTGFGAAAQQQQPASSGFSFGAKPATGGFGGFGSTPGTGLTGATGFGAANTGTSAFGGAATPFGQAAKPPTTSPFGGIGTNTQSTFGQPQSAGFGKTPTTPGFGLGTTTPGQTGGLFGAPANTQTPATGGLFGTGGLSTTTTPGGLLGSATATPGTTGGFGTSTTLGGTNAFGGGAFGAAKPAGGGLFGTTPQQTPAPSTGFSFGQTQPQTGTTTGGLFGSSGGIGGKGFGTTPGGFGTSTTTGFGGNSNLLSSTLFGSQQQQNVAGPSLQASIDKNPYGNNPLFDASTIKQPNKPSSSTEPQLFATTSAEKKQPILPHFKVTPRSANKMKLRGFSPATVGGDFSTNAQPSKSSSSKDGGLPKGVVNLLKAEQNDPLSRDFPEAFKPRIKKLIITNDASGASTLGGVAQTPVAQKIGGTAPPSTAKAVRFVDENDAGPPVVDVTGDYDKRSPGKSSQSPSANNSAANTPKSVNSGSQGGLSSLGGTPAAATKAGSASNSPMANSSSEPSSASKNKSPSKAPEYVTEPPIEEIMDMSEAELSRLENFTVSLPGVGKIRFLEPVNLIQASPTGTIEGIAKIPGTVIILRHKVVEVYPDETEKDPVGMGVNVAAEVQLERCWAVDKSTGKVIEDETDPRFEKHFRKLESVPGTKMLGFNKKTGCWRFRIESF